MKALLLIVNAVFLSNALFMYGLGTLDRRDSILFALKNAFVLILLCLLMSILALLANKYFLAHFGLQSISILLVIGIVLPLFGTLSKLLAKNESIKMRLPAFAIREVFAGTIVFGIAILATNTNLDFFGVVLSSLSASFGYVMARTLTDSIRWRLDLSKVPKAFRGYPSILISIGLISMVLYGFRMALF